MSRLRQHESGGAACAECQAKPPVGPCAACESMICGDCGVLTRDPNGQKCICTSCARLIATVGERPQRRKSSTTFIAIAIVVAFGLAAIGGLFAVN